MKGQGYTLKSFEFRREREATWRELAELMDRVEDRGLRSLDDDELARLPELYRATLSSLAVARAISLDKNLVTWLEGLSARAYLAVYSTRRRFGATVVEFFTERFPRLVWGMRRGLLLSVVLLVVGTVVGLLMTLDDPARFHAFVDPAYAQDRGPESSREELRAVLYDDQGGAAEMLSAFASFLFTHNAKIGLLCFALGFAAGVPVMLLVFTNGLILGAFAAIHVDEGLGVDLWAWLLPHGVTELLAVCVCAAAGLAVGHAVVFPGPYRRLQNVARRGREAALVVVGAVALFFVAALIEGFFRQLVHSIPARLTLATVTAVFWAWYFLVLGRRRAP
ncbi:MAG: stage II sporulation protein M [Myxococcota bacterium]